MTVGDACTRNVEIAVKSEPIVEAARHMRTAHVGDLVVIETHESRRVPVGIITDRDIVVSAVAADSGHFDSLVVGDIMTRKPTTAREQETLESAIAKMDRHGVRRLPVVNAEGALVGILTLDDALQVLLAAQQPELAKIARIGLEQPRREQFRL